MSFTAGYSQGVTWTVSGGSAVTLNITDYDWAEEVERLIATNSLTAGKQALIAGVFSGDCTVNALVDASNLPNTFMMKAGQKGTINVAVGSTNPFAIPCMIVKVNYKSSMSSLVNYNFTVGYDALSGTYQYPS